ncbi:MAG: alpha/beta hydrolase-fold protein [Proteobacteria bacterium]|nr:alpha/beta hydrolase-fold protein [Pseudomonadota bacterium]
MPEHNYARPRGRIEYLTIASRALECNVLGDPAERVVAIYLPPDYDQSGREYPLLVDIVGFTGSGFGHIGWKPFQESVPQRIDRLVDEGKMGNVVVALPDCFTSLGGNQYIDSAAMGLWGEFLTAEMLPAIEDRYRVRRGRKGRGLFGKSSGGYGAIVHGMIYAGHWGAIACHSGDMGFDRCYLPEMPGVLMKLAGYHREVSKGVEAFMKKQAAARKTQDMHTLMMMAMAASYDPDPTAPFGIRLPVTSDTCEVIPERWQQWLQWDPVVMIERSDVQDSLRSLAGVYIDCGSHDQYKLVFGARQLDKRLNELGIPHRFEEFPDSHTSVDYRMDESLPFLFKVLDQGD